MLLKAEVYVYEDDKMIQEFVGLSNEYIEGIFVSDEMQSCDIDKRSGVYFIGDLAQQNTLEEFDQKVITEIPESYL